MDPYLKAKVEGNAAMLIKQHHINRAQARDITERLWSEARAAILKHVKPEEWAGLSVADKSHICGEVIKALLDKKKLAGFLAGERKHLI